MLKKFSIGSYIMAASFLVAFIAFIIAIISNTHTGYEMTNMAATVLLSIVALGGMGLLFFLTYKKGNDPLISAIEIIVVICLGFCLWSMIVGKLDVFGTVMLSDLEKGYIPAENACWQGLTSIIFYLVAAVLAIIGSFTKLAKE